MADEGGCPFKHYPKLAFAFAALVGGFFALKFFGIL
jgi:hypothetical protein